MKDCLRFYIDGSWVDPISGRTMPRVNPASEEVVGRVAIGSAGDVDRAVKAAAAAFEHFQYSSRQERMALFERIIRAADARRADLGAAITNDIGVPAWFANGYQTDMALDHFAEARRLLETYPFEYRLGDNTIRREAFGVCGLITAWNWPAQLVTSKVAGALAAGCTVVLKPSEYSPCTAVVLAEIMHAAEVPKGVFNLVLGDGPGVGAAISNHEGIELISFTGSKAAGVAITKAAAETVKAVHLELGGKSANIILPDADLQVAVADGVRRAFINSGQSCIAPTRMLIHEDQMARALSIARDTAEGMVVGPPLDAQTKLGPVANAAQFDRVQDLIRAGIDGGATLVCGGLGRPEGLTHGFFVKPTVFADVRPDMRIAQEEIFGPVLSILSYRDEEHAIQIANGTTYGLAGYVFSSDLRRAARVGSKLKAGRIFLNGAPTNAMAPFGGYKQSGNGREWGVFGLETFLEVKAVLGDLVDV
ncbi:aldehyde dehydrogenase (NAD+) [Variovorax boronicumulans]|uniref:aldehyde dehydrogenase family protein n=1 Tax=Variovorax boronicumulans TaxID=436515 RepID=UPI00247560C0|nr:aldehyde dehydrogenase family protein [Variovorax boronicumulans]MDH6169992.1 aldehyde dehydrogenase (NAD+) [Variovorax boronicumulans]